MSSRGPTVCAACGKPAYWRGLSEMYVCKEGHSQLNRSSPSLSLRSKSLLTDNGSHNWRIVTLAKPTGVTITLVVNETEILGWYPGSGLRVFRALKGLTIPQNVFERFTEAVEVCREGSS